MRGFKSALLLAAISAVSVGWNTSSYAQGAGSVAIVPLSSPPDSCQAGTGSAISSVPTSATTICLAALNGKRSWWRIAILGSYPIFCTDDGSTPTSTAWNFYVPANAWAISDAQMVSPMVIQCIASGGSTTISAEAVQSGQP